MSAAQARAAARKARDLTRRKSALENSRAAGQARRLLRARPLADRAVHRRGRLRGRLGQAGPRPRDPGGAPAARQDPQCREGAHRQGAAEHGDPGADHGARLGRARRLRHRALALPQDRPDDGRRRRRRAHPHADPHAAVPRDAGADRGRLHLHRQAAALQADAGPPGALHREGVRARGDPARRQARPHRGRRRATATTFKLTDNRWQRYRRLLKQYEGWARGAAGRVRRRHRDVPRGVADPRRADHDGRGPRSRSSSATDPETEPYIDRARRLRRRRDPRQGDGAQVQHGAHDAPAPLAVRGQRVPPARARARRAHRHGRHAAVHRQARRRRTRTRCRSRTCRAPCSRSPRRA